MADDNINISISIIAVAVLTALTWNFFILDSAIADKCMKILSEAALERYVCVPLTIFWRLIPISICKRGDD